MKLIIIPILALLLVPFILADDEIMFPQLGDGELYISNNFGDAELNVFYMFPICGNGVCETDENCAICIIDCGVCPRGGGSVGGVSKDGHYKYYDVLVDILKDEYNSQQTIEANITLLLFTDEIPKKDGILKYHLINPDGEKVKETMETIREGNHSRLLYLDVPSDSEYGLWKFEVVWYAEGIPLINSYDSFKLIRYPQWIIIVIGLVLVAFISQSIREDEYV